MHPPASDELLVAEQIGPTRLVTINRPERLNALTPALIGDLERAFDDAESDEATRTVIVTGAGSKAFVAGNDIDGLIELDSEAAYRDMRRGQRLLLKIHEFGKPTIAMVNGYALGGGFELALACDFVIASESARFGFPEITLNTMPGWGGTQLAVKRMGLSRAKQMVLTGRHFSTDECRDFGFIDRIVPAQDLLTEALAFAEQLSRHDGFAVEMAKRAVNRACDIPLHAGLELEAANYAVNFTTSAARDGLRAFAARRKRGTASASPPSRS